MAIPKVFGIETEYGIAAAGDRRLQPGPVLVAPDQRLRGRRCAGSAGTTSRSRRCATLAASSPCRRGSRPTRTSASRNVILPNGARYYVDHAHPEYSTPECLTPRELVVHDKAGERILERSLAEAAARACPTRQRCRSTRTTPTARATPTGRTRTTWWTARTPFARHRPRPHAVLRDAARCSPARGRSGPRRSGTDAAAIAYQLTQRADFFETEVGLETTLKRPIINTRDEPHADPEQVPAPARDRRRRQHVRGLARS